MKSIPIEIIVNCEHYEMYVLDWEALRVWFAFIPSISEATALIFWQLC